MSLSVAGKHHSLSRDCWKTLLVATPPPSAHCRSLHAREQFCRRHSIRNHSVRRRSSYPQEKVAIVLNRRQVQSRKLLHLVRDKGSVL